MKHPPTNKRGIRQRRKESMPPALRLSVKDKLKIGKLARLRGTSASRSVMELVEKALRPAKSEKTVRKTIGPKRRLTGKELMALPPDVRHRRFEAQAKKAAIYYRTDPDLDFQLNDDILES